LFLFCSRFVLVLAPFSEPERIVPGGHVEFFVHRDAPTDLIAVLGILSGTVVSTTGIFSDYNIETVKSVVHHADGCCTQSVALQERVKAIEVRHATTPKLMIEVG
jgi:hypothetical protein